MTPINLLNELPLEPITNSFLAPSVRDLFRICTAEYTSDWLWSFQHIYVLKFFIYFVCWQFILFQ